MGNSKYFFVSFSSPSLITALAVLTGSLLCKWHLLCRLSAGVWFFLWAFAGVVADWNSRWADWAGQNEMRFILHQLRRRCCSLNGVPVPSFPYIRARLHVSLPSLLFVLLSSSLSFVSSSLCRSFLFRSPDRLPRLSSRSGSRFSMARLWRRQPRGTRRVRLLDAEFKCVRVVFRVCRRVFASRDRT